MAARKKQNSIAPTLTPEQRQAIEVEYAEAYGVMAACTQLKRYRESLANLPDRRARAGNDWAGKCPWVGLPPGMSEDELVAEIERLDQELTPKRRAWMCSVMQRHMTCFDERLYLTN